MPPTVETRDLGVLVSLHLTVRKQNKRAFKFCTRAQWRKRNADDTDTSPSRVISMNPGFGASESRRAALQSDVTACPRLVGGWKRAVSQRTKVAKQPSHVLPWLKPAHVGHVNVNRVHRTRTQASWSIAAFTACARIVWSAARCVPYDRLHACTAPLSLGSTR